jgi:hypothetical protein
MHESKPSSKSKSWNKKHNMNAKGLYFKTITRTKEDHNKNTYSKVVLNKLNVMWILPLFICIGHLAQKTF